MRSLAEVWAVMLLFAAIIGWIYFGLMTATEAAAVGSFLTWLIGILRGRLDFQRSLKVWSRRCAPPLPSTRS